MSPVLEGCGVDFKPSPGFSEARAQDRTKKMKLLSPPPASHKNSQMGLTGLVSPLVKRCWFASQQIMLQPSPN